MAYVPQDPLVPGGNYTPAAPPNQSNVPGAQMTPQQAATFSQLVQTYGLSTALQLFRLIAPGVSIPQRAIAAANLASSGINAAQAAGYAVPAGLGQVAGGLGSAAALAGFGYNLANIAGNDTLTNKQKVGAGVQSGIDTGLSYAFPVYGLLKAAQGVGKQLERSGSPQVAGLGRTIDYGVETGSMQQLKGILAGRQNPKDAWNENGKLGGAAMDLALPGINAILKGIGINVGVNTPTSEGGMFRQGFGRVLDRFNLPINKNFQDRSAYNAPVDPNIAQGKPGTTSETWLAKYGHGPVDAAMDWSTRFAAPGSDAQTQVLNMLLNNYGADVPKYYAEFLKNPLAAPPPGAPPVPPPAAKVPGSPANPAAPIAPGPVAQAQAAGAPPLPGSDVASMVNQQMLAKRQGALSLIQQLMGQYQQSWM